MTDRLVAHFRAMARNNAWANARLLGACEALTAAEFAAPRVSFFPSLRATLNHLHAVDLYYIDALEGAGRGPAAFGDAPDFAEPAALRAAQAASDARLIALCDRLSAADLDRPVPTDRGAAGIVAERRDWLLAHLFLPRSTTAARPTPCSPAPGCRRRSSTSSSSTSTAIRASPSWG
jgi:uncharacterized damage-inducible protein DinB